MRIWISATCLSKFRAMRDWPSNFLQCIQSSGNRSPGSLSDSPHISTWLRRWYPLQRRQRVRPRYRCALTASLRAIAPALVGFQGFAFLRGGITACASRAAIASWHLCVSYAPSAVTLPMSWSAGIWFRSYGNTGASLMLLLMTSTARTSSVSSSMPMCILRQRRRLGSPCLRAFHSPLHSALIPVLSIRRFSGPAQPRYGRLTFSVC